MDKTQKRMIKQFIAGADRKTLIHIRKAITAKLESGINTLRRPIGEEGLSRVMPSAYKPKEAMFALINEDWSHLFERFDNAKKEHYVYVHFDPKAPVITYRFNSGFNVDMKDPFYVGCGTGNRSQSANRSVMHTKRIQGLMAGGYSKDEFITLFESGLTEREARELESKLILFFGVKSAIPAKAVKTGTKALSGKPHCLYNSQYEPMPKKYERIALNGIKINELAKLRMAEELERGK